MGLFIALVVIVLVVGYIIIDSYNRLVTYKNRYGNAYAQIDVQLRRRHDLIPNLVETVKGYMKHERETLEAVITARNAAVTATQRASQAPGDPRAMEQLGQAEGLLTGALGRLMVLSEAYPDLKANQNMSELMEELRSTENKISFARQAFNDAVTLYNTKREVFPSNLIANAFNFQAAQLLEESAPEVKEVPRISF
ncbi:MULTISPECIES: LemA family protein [unclassified Leptolyngbya]|uniref:LemA family protein n=1 Tax=unclassified Leptolyngbya TaxID=2650499 RepID=UPI00168592C5|nr:MULTISPECIES: LemA family protein [unclassified Leptolyngbya]MBD1910236.1 LemA family protein [Leptolyngbya sp. FACHB-8]MBD2156441.1 LemA family protein [Leptolyngbya sp. FACHB-16]